MSIQVCCGFRAKGAVGDGWGEGSGTAIGNEAEVLCPKTPGMDFIHMSDELLASLKRSGLMVSRGAVPSCAMLGAHVREPLLARGVKFIRLGAVVEDTNVCVEILLYMVPVPIY